MQSKAPSNAFGNVRTAIYADHAATTPPDPRVVEAMLPFLAEKYYNPSALYPEAGAVKQVLEAARSTLLELTGGDGRIIFTGSGTEAANLALHSAAFCGGNSGTGGGRILVSAVEHHAVLNSAAALKAQGFTVEHLAVNRHGVVSPDTLTERMDGDVRLVSIMQVNNETGAVNDTPALCRIARSWGALFHTDAVQALGILPLDVKAIGADYVSFSAHKIYGPKGVGALYTAPGAPLFPVIQGGGQEGGFRAGTENTAGIAGFGCAAAIVRTQLVEDAAHLHRLKEIFLEGIAGISGLVVNSPADGAPHIINVSAAGVEAEHCLLRLSMAGILASMGAACNASSVEPSHVVEAIGVPGEYKRGTMRFSFGRGTTEEDTVRTALELARALEKTRYSR